MPDTTIIRLLARRVWDSRGHPTVEAEVQLACGAIGRAIAPAGASRGAREAVDLRDGGPRFGGLDVLQAVAHVEGPIAQALLGRDARAQAEIDGELARLDGSPQFSRLGGNATIAASMAVLHAAAAAHGEPLWRYLAEGKPVRLPLPQIQIFGGGAHASRRVDVQDFMVVAVGAERYVQALEMTAEVYRAAGRLMAEAGRLQGVADEGGYWPAFDSNEQALETLIRAIEAAGFTPGDEVAIALDVAASQFGAKGHYRLALDRWERDRDGMIELLLAWIDRYPIVSVEDPLAEDDTLGWMAFTRAAGDRVQVVGDDFLVTNAALVEGAARERTCTAALIKPNQAGTVTAAKAALEAAKRAGFGTLVSARSGETEDVTIAHLAVGWDAGQLKVGSFSRSERMAKWNEGLRIEAALGPGARFAGQAALRRAG